MKNTDRTSIKIRKAIYEFLIMVFQYTGMMAILFPVLFLLVSISLQFTPQNYETAIAIRTLRGVVLITGSGAFVGFLIGFGLGFVLHILPLFYALKNEKSDDVVEITR